MRNAREAQRGFGRCGTQAEREGGGRSLQAKRSISQPPRATMRVHKKAVQMTRLVCLLATTVCVQGAFLFTARHFVSAGPVSKAEISLHPECRAKEQNVRNAP